MIKNSELMLGDYVLVSGTPRKVEMITKNKIGYHINPQTDDRLHYARLRDVEPIEITEEFLTKNGYREDNSGLYVDSYGEFGYFDEYGHYNDIKYLITVDKKNKIFCSHFYRDLGSGETKIIGNFSYLCSYYIHQLQQAYRLWGITIDWQL